MDEQLTIEAMKTNLKQLGQTIIKLKRRALTSKQIESASWKIWMIARDNKRSLDSERFGNLIRQSLEDVACELQKQLEEMEVEFAALVVSQTKLSRSHDELETKLKNVRTENDQKNRRIAKLEKELQESKREIKRIKADCKDNDGSSKKLL